MSYQRSILGQDEEDVVWSEVQWNIPGSGVQIMPSGYGTPQENYPYTTLPSQKTSSWWSGITDILVPVSAAASNIIRAVTGQPVPPGSVYNPSTGQYIPAPSTAQSWLIPALLVGGGLLIVTRMRKK